MAGQVDAAGLGIRRDGGGPVGQERAAGRDLAAILVLGRGQVYEQQRVFERGLEELLAASIPRLLAGLPGEPEVVIGGLALAVYLDEGDLAQPAALAAQVGAVERGEQRGELDFQLQAAGMRDGHAQMVGVNSGVGPAVHRQQPFQPFGVELDEQVAGGRVGGRLGDRADEHRFARGPKRLADAWGPIAVEAILADGNEIGRARLPRADGPAARGRAAPDRVELHADDAVVHGGTSPGRARCVTPGRG